MKKVKKRRTLFKDSRKVLLLGLALVLIICSALFYKSSNREAAISVAEEPQETINLAPATDTEKKEAEDRKLQQFDDVKLGTDDQPAVSSSSNTDSVKISKLYQDQSSKEVVAQTELKGTGWKECTITFSRNGQTFTRNAEVIYQSSYSSCLGFAVKSDEFPLGGEWSVSLTASKSNGTTQTSSLKMINVIR